MTKFSESSDKQFAKDIINVAPAQTAAWFNFEHEVNEKETKIPLKFKELIALGVSLTTQCPYCMEKHIKLAKQHGATQEEIAETILISAALRSGAAMGYGLLAMKLFKAED
ncbi:carboxymuconolactone decarboxylase family protein [Elizabethkingia miricola]|uniref:carboxymuconolactone decarboxylase family protein n=1 Tax=Elizabethkingia miricola TaxID=172045 RepID=UPI000B35C873|nr:carboxymuconolactone decarboxylase family protein [Elizabethkingia miricola]NHQ65234.1 carboxymuconolactone decarboxylase family protein [Elizabethkingia miricola]NHQ72097.1 carboxymuconolactone decarboxylase family protein [Elizabethkingia miricola]NHQ76397.1 carboxymuconolactone decarboxylase family protein [Elizabethkingia miricola]PSL87821.1 carboxymuconolactone decarboxylase family protein [Elizabethkingia miricola]QHQ86246.1 carboxymuconolactone decarboxylase family protein [Elizabeth